MSPILKRYNGTDYERVGSISAFNSGPAATLGYAERLTTQTGIGNTDTDITGLSVTVTVPAGRRIMISAFAVIQQRTAAALDFFFIKEGATQLTEDLQSVGAVDEYWTANPVVVISPSAGTHTYKVAARATAGTLEVNGGASIPAYILVEDITGSTLPYNPASVPVGSLGYAFMPGDQSGISTEVALTNLSVNVVVPAGRRLLISSSIDLQSTADGDVVLLRIKEDGVFIQRSTIEVGDATNRSFTVPISVVRSPAAGAHVYTVTLERSAGTGTLTANGANAACYLSVEDITPTPSASSGAPGSTLGYAENAGLSQAVTTATDLTNLSVTVTVPAGRRIRITGHSSVQQSVADQRSILNIQEGATVLSVGSVNQSEAGINELCECHYVGSPTAGTHTYKLVGSTDAGTCTFQGGATNPAFILVEDITGSLWPLGSPVTAGMVASEAWTGVTPTVTQSGAVTYTVVNAKYIKIGRTVHFTYNLAITGTGTAANDITITLPIAAVSQDQIIGIGWVFDSSANLLYTGSVEVNNATPTIAKIRGMSATGNLGSVGFTAALTSPDVVRLSGTYEAAA